MQDDSIYSGQYELFSGGKVLYDAIDLVDHYKKNPIIQDAMKKLENYAAEKKQKNQSVSNIQEKKQEQVADKPPKKKEARQIWDAGNWSIPEGWNKLPCIIEIPDRLR